MPGDPAVSLLPTCSTLSHWSYQHSGQTTSRHGLFRVSLSSREWLVFKPSLIIASSLWCRRLPSKLLTSSGTLQPNIPINFSRTGYSRCLRSTTLLALNDFACPEAIAYLPLTGNMQPSNLMSRMLGLLSASHEPCFFLRTAFLKRLPANIRAHLVHNRTSDPLTLTLRADKVFQSFESYASTKNHVSSTLVLGNDFSVHAVHRQASSRAPCSSTPGTRSGHAPAAPSASCRLDSPSLCWYTRSHCDQAQKCLAPCSWSGN